MTVRRASLIFLTLGMIGCCVAQGPGPAQAAEPLPAIADLPRPGYEQRGIRLGGWVIDPAVDAGVMRDSNILATPIDKRNDRIVALDARMVADEQFARGGVRLTATANLLRFDRNPRENVSLFGGSASGQASIGSRRSVRARLGFDRGYERRSDPEAMFNRDRSPVLINFTEATVELRERGNRFGYAATIGASRIDYLRERDADRDLTNYQVTLRGTVSVSPRASGFVQVFGVRRDNRLPVDRFGVDRDSRTFGVLAGVAFELTGRVTGEMGLGAFRQDPEQAGFVSFTGLAASGQLVWRPRARTAVTLDVSRGDVATIRFGATGRIDERAILTIDQEARHNLLFRVAAGFRNANYRGLPGTDQRLRFAEIEADYLVDRHLRLIARANYTRRNADDFNDRFRRSQLIVGARFVY